VIFDVVTLFPGVFPGPLGAGVVGRAIERELLQVDAHDLRESAGDKHRQVDDIPYGGGPGMVLKPEPIFKAVRQLQEAVPAPCVLLTPQGRPLDHDLAMQLAATEYERVGALFAVVRQMQIDQNQTGQADRNVEEKDEPPVKVSDDQATSDGA